MVIRSLQETDLEQIYNIWLDYYRDEFTFEEFQGHFLARFVVADNDNKIITAGGIRTICESVIVTDMSQSGYVRGKALLKLLEVSEFLAKKAGYRELHATAQDKKWEKILNKYGFLEPKGKFLSRTL